jgi:hypothetical protein
VNPFTKLSSDDEITVLTDSEKQIMKKDEAVRFYSRLREAYIMDLKDYSYSKAQSTGIADTVFLSIYKTNDRMYYGDGGLQLSMTVYNDYKYTLDVLRDYGLLSLEPASADP